MAEAEEERGVVAFAHKRVAAALTLLTSCDLDDVNVDDSEQQREQRVLQDAASYLDEFQEQPYLLDQSLDQLALPVLFRLRDYLRPARRLPLSHARLLRLVRWIYQLTKIRGYKAIVRLFPHEVADLDVLLDLFQKGEEVLVEPASWELRYVLLIWLSLVCMLPFDLARWNRANVETSTSQYLVDLGYMHLSSPGKERDAAAIMLGKLLTRQDVSRELLPSFLTQAERALPVLDFLSVGLLQALCEAIKAGTRLILLPYLPALYRLLALFDPAPANVRNALVRRYRVKLAGRLALLFLPRTRKPQRRKARAIALAAPLTHAAIAEEAEQDSDVPDEVEVLAQEILDALEDVDTGVRYSAAKHIARLIEALPASMAEQILDIAIDSFGKGVPTPAGGPGRHLTAISDSRWHGLCLLVAECARRSLIPANKLSIIFPWIFLALQFDQRRGTKTVGGNVRDAAAYVVWSFARAYEPAELERFAADLAKQLVLASLFDREIHIRRAASAAFQEVVGRLGIVPHGIALLPVLDYYTCGIRRTAFLVAAPAVAGYATYRPAVLSHLLDVALIHYDTNMRELAAQCLHLVLREDTTELQSALQQLKSRLSARIQPVLHGSLLALAANVPLADASLAGQVLAGLADMSPTALAGFGSDMIVEAALNAVAEAAKRIAPSHSSIPAHIVAFATAAGKKTSSTCHVAAAAAFGEISRTYDAASEVKRYVPFPTAVRYLADRLATLLAALKAFSPSVQQCSALCLGRVAPDAPQMDLIWRSLAAFVDVKAVKHASSVEARRNGLHSLVSILTVAAPQDSRVLRERARQLYDLFDSGLVDYTNDQRGDVGSWIRMASMEGLVDLLTCGNLMDCYEDGDRLNIISACLRLAIERIDGVREVAIAQLTRLTNNSASGGIPKSELERALAQLDASEHRDLAVTLPIVLSLLHISSLRMAILEGLCTSYSSSATSAVVTSALLPYLHQLPSHDTAQAYSCGTLLHDSVNLASDYTTNTRIFVPALRLLTFFLSATAFSDLLMGSKAAEVLTPLLNLVSQRAPSCRTAQRAIALGDVYLAVFPFDNVRALTVPLLPVFLGHRLISVREHVATALYERALLADNPEAEESVLETAWATPEAEIAAQRLAELLLSAS